MPKCIYFNLPYHNTFSLYWLKEDYEYIGKEILGLEESSVNLQTEQFYDSYDNSEPDIGTEHGNIILGGFTCSKDWKNAFIDIEKLKYENTEIFDECNSMLHVLRTYDTTFNVRFVGKSFTTGIENNPDLWIEVYHGKTHQKITDFILLYEAVNLNQFNNVESENYNFLVIDMMKLNDLDEFNNVSSDSTNDVYYYKVNYEHNEVCLPLLEIEDKRFNITEEDSLPDPENLQGEEGKLLYETQLKKLDDLLKANVSLPLIEFEKFIITIGDDPNYLYSVDSYPSVEILKALNNIIYYEENNDIIGVFILEKMIQEYIQTYAEELKTLYNVNSLKDVPTGGRIGDDGNFIYDINTMIEFIGKIYKINENHVDVFYPNITTVDERHTAWLHLKEEYINFETYIKSLDTQTPIPSQIVTIIKIEMAELEIYDKEEIYSIFESSLKDGSIDIVSELTTTMNMSINEFLTWIIKNYIDEKDELIENVKPITFCAYRQPKYEENEIKQNVNGLIEYTQMLQTIQTERNVINYIPNKTSNLLKEQIIIKLLQTPIGTIIEFLEPEEVSSTMTSIIQGFYLSKGNNNDENSIRMIKIPKFYEGEPIDWCNDNYYSNIIYDQNADNLYVEIDPEFKSRNTSFNSNLNDENMIGYYIIELEYK